MTGRPDDAKLRWMNSSRLQVRQVDELVGLAKGIVADSILNNDELAYLVRWLVANREVANDPVVDLLYERVRLMLADGVFDDDERADLLATLKDFGSDPIEMGEVMKSASIPFSDPTPLLGFAGWRYCFTGTFNHGVRANCEATVQSRGATAGSLTKTTDVLVVGQYATESWLHSSYGRKIMKAVEMRNGGHHIAIVAEDHWASHL